MSKPTKYTAAIPEDSIPEVGEDTDSSDEEHGTVRKHRWNKRPRISVVSEANPSPRVSEFQAPNPALLDYPENSQDTVSTDSEVRRALIQRVAWVALIVVTVCLLVAVIYLASEKPESQLCSYSDTDYVTPRDFDNPEVFDDLTEKEYEAVYKLMLKDKQLGLKHMKDANVNSSYIFMIDLFLPDKHETIQYLDHGSKRPIREAIVTVYRGDQMPPTVEEYVVSPTSEPNSIRLYKNPSYRRYPIPFTSRPVDGVEYEFLYSSILLRFTEELYPLLMESYGLCYHNCTEGVNCLHIFDMAPRGKVSGERKSWAWMFPDIEGYYMHPLGLEFLIDHSSTDSTQWYVEKIVYNGQQFDSVSALMTAYRQKSLKLIKLHSFKENPSYSSYEPRGDHPEKPIQGPRLIEPDGKRFKVYGQRVEYDQWSFRYHMKSTTGLNLFDIKFEDTRIAYEISLQEVLVYYTGYSPIQGVSNYYDVSWNLGATNMELVRGVDCPDTAVYLDTYFYNIKGKAERYKRNICIFENNGGKPLRRHYQNKFDGGYKFYGGVVDYNLVIRTIANVWNYDYIFDYIFYTNGAIEVKVSATGYVQSAFKLPEEIQYGSPLHYHVVANLHLHIFNHKVDLDISGEKNRYTVLNVGKETVEPPWYQKYNKTQMNIRTELIDRESKSPTYKGDIPQYHIIHNHNAKSQYGAERAYRILNKSPVLNVMSGEPVAASAKWANYPIIVTKRKESERSSTSIFAQNDPWDPIVDFEEFIDGDDLLDEDLVAWVTTGTHHIPGTEDIPSTPTTWNQYSFFLTPHNYFTECPSIYSQDNVLIRPSQSKNIQPKVETYGQSFKTKCIPQSEGPYSFDGIRR